MTHQRTLENPLPGKTESLIQSVLNAVEEKLRRANQGSVSNSESCEMVDDKATNGP